MTVPATGHHLPARAPFDFGQSLRFLGGFTPGAGELTLGARELRRAVRLDGQTVGVTLMAEGDGVRADLQPERPLSGTETRRVLVRLSDFLGLDDDLSPFLARASGDAPFAPVLERLRGFHQPRFLTPFEAACWAILSQRTPAARARGIKRGLSEDFGGVWNGLPAFPEPADLGGLGEKEAAKRLGSERRGKALLAAARAFAQVDPDWLRSAASAEVETWLTGIYGVGAWSAQLVLIRGLGRTDRLDRIEGPLEAELLRAARPIYGELTAAQLHAVAARYGDQAGLWAFYLRSQGG